MRRISSLTSAFVIATGFVATVRAQESPFAYPGMPTTPYGADWQAYYRVTTALPNVTFTLPGTYAGSISVDRSGHTNNSLFFVGFENSEGSLTASENERSNEPWMIWLNGGPGSSSMFGLFAEHGPMLLAYADGDTTGQRQVIKENPWSWHKQANIIYIDQPVGTGYSTADFQGYVADEDQMARDFVNFLKNLASVFPSLKHRPLYLTGESYAGTYIPYITKALTLNRTTPAPVNLAKIVIGDGTIGNYGAFTEYSTLSVLQSYPQLIGFEPSVYEYFVEQYNLCGYNLTLEYPASNPYPRLRDPYVDPGVTSKAESNGEETPPMANSRWRGLDALAMIQDTVELYKIPHEKRSEEISYNGKRFVKRQQTSPGSVLAPIGTIDSYYGCFLMEQLWDYATNYTAPWRRIDFDVYRISDALSPSSVNNPAQYLNDEVVRAAFHAPKKTFRMSFRYPFGNSFNGDPSPEPQTFISEISEHVPIILFSGNDDSLVGHRGTELAIQNMTFGGIRGFTIRPSTPFSDTDGNFAGIIHQERNVTYALFTGAGHMVPTDKPKAAYAFLQEFVLGTNTTGLVVPPSAEATGTRSVSVVGGVHTEYLKGIFTGTEAYTGAYVTQGVYTWGEASWKAWGNYMASRTGADVPVASATGDGFITSGSGGQTNPATTTVAFDCRWIWTFAVPVITACIGGLLL
ncbi:hypothetical protein FRC16_009729 [Serendipita sp. 398]|nr:hypothetical protein FRC16_009729 [Serendipita sp. 398]